MTPSQAAQHNEGTCDLCTGWHDAEEAAFMNRRASQAAQEKPTSPRTRWTFTTPLSIEVSGGVTHIRLREAAAATPSLDRDVLAEVMWDTSNAGAETPWIDVPLESVRRSDMLGWAQAIVREYHRLARLDEGSATPDNLSDLSLSSVSAEGSATPDASIEQLAGGSGLVSSAPRPTDPDYLPCDRAHPGHSHSDWLAADVAQRIHWTVEVEAATPDQGKGEPR